MLSQELTDAIKQIANIDNALIALSAQAKEQTESIGKVSADTLLAILVLGVYRRGREKYRGAR